MFASIWKWIKIVVGVLLAVGLAIITLGAVRKGKLAPVPPKVGEAEHKADVDTAAAAKLDKDRQDKEGEIVTAAEDTKTALQDIENRKEQPGDAKKAAEDLKKVW